MSSTEDTHLNKTLPPTERPINIMPMALAFEGGLAVLACAVGWLLDPPVWQRVIWSSNDLGLGLLAILPLIIGLLVMRRVHRGSLGRLNAVVDELLVPLFAGCGMMQLAMISLVAGIGEELLFRGVVQPLLIGWLGVVIGIGLASVVFGLLHSITPAYAVLATAVGVYFGWFAWASGNLLGPIVAHGPLYDFLALVYVTRWKRPTAITPPAA